MIVKDNPLLIANYLEDCSALKGKAEKVLFPENEEDLIEIFEIARNKKIPLTISGGGTGVCGARVPLGGWVIATDKMDRIKKIENIKERWIAEVEAGVSGVKLCQELERHNLIYPPLPTERNSYIGGNIATNASGERSYKYGSVRRWVRKIKVILTTGEILEIRRGKIFAHKRNLIFKINNKIKRIKLPSYQMPLIKNSAGYYVKDNMDLIDLFIGQEGTLGFITEAELALQPKEAEFIPFFLFFSQLEKAISFLEFIKKLAIDICSLEFFDNNSLNFLRQKYPNIPYSEGVLFIETEVKRGQKDNFLDFWTKLIENNGPGLENTWIADTQKDKDFLREIRYQLPLLINEEVRRRGFLKIGTDITVPHSKLRVMFYFFQEILRKTTLDWVLFGHFGESHFHLNILPKNEKELEQALKVYHCLCERAIEFGGTIAGEHGIGKLKHKYLEMMYGKDKIMEMVQLKKEFDPSCILGLDNIFPHDLL